MWGLLVLDVTTRDEPFVIKIDTSTDSARPCGDLDLATAPMLGRALAATANFAPAATVWLNLEDVTFIDASALGVVVSSRHRRRLLGGDLVVTGASPGIRRVFRLAGLPHLLEPSPLAAPVVGV
jgi:anti-sigma B factor antagonist